jgi:hypothetical protein
MFDFIVEILKTPASESGYKLMTHPVPRLLRLGLLRLGPLTNVTDDRDRLYGLLNVMEPEIAALVKPDYTAHCNCSPL